MEDALSQLPISFIVGIATILGLIVGSFLNVVILRLPKMMERNWRSDCCDLLDIKPSSQVSSDVVPPTFNLVFPGSHCPKCGHKVQPWENIPVVSYLFLRGKCSSCSNGISLRYPLIELITGIVSGLLIYHFGPSLQGFFSLILFWSLITLTMIDIDTKYLPDDITLPLMWLGLLVNACGVFPDITVVDSIYGAAAGYLSLWSVFWLFKLITKKEGMGYGDFKLLAALGAWMGWQSLPLIIILSSLVGTVIGVAGIIIQGRDKNIPIPFGPYLAIAGAIAFLWGDHITQFYLQFAGLQ